MQPQHASGGLTIPPADSGAARRPGLRSSRAHDRVLTTRRLTEPEPRCVTVYVCFSSIGIPPICTSLPDYIPGIGSRQEDGPELKGRAGTCRRAPGSSSARPAAAAARAAAGTRAGGRSGPAGRGHRLPLHLRLAGWGRPRRPVARVAGGPARGYALAVRASEYPDMGTRRGTCGDGMDAARQASFPARGTSKGRPTTAPMPPQARANGTIGTGRTTPDATHRSRRRHGATNP